MRVYICGPITGYPDGNQALFATATAAARAKGWEVVSPIEMDTPEELAETLVDHYGPVYWERLLEDLRIIVGVDALLLLEGWGDSKGAWIEVEWATAQNKQFYHWTSGEIV